MKKILFLGFVLIGLLSIQSCSLDNYDEPTATLTGMLVDAKTRKSIPCQYKNGARIRMYEYYNGEWAKQPNDFYTKQDGSFTNNTVFPGKYQILAEGAFVTPDVIEIDIPKTSVLEIQVIPFLRISGTATVANNAVTLKAIVEPTESKKEIKTVEFYCGKTPYVDKNTYDKKITVPNVNSLETIDVTKVFEDLTKGHTYYFRIGGLGENSGNFYNYSEVMEISIP